MLNTNIKPILKKTGWSAVSLLLLILLAFTVVRVMALYFDGGGIPSGSSSTDFEARFLEHPTIVALHMLFSMTFVLLAPLQFSKKLRTRHRAWHRQLGRVLIFCAIVSGIYGLVSVVALPIFGGLATETAAWFFGPLFILSAIFGFWRARQKMFTKHREWMIRTFALGLGVGTHRLYVIIFMFSGAQFADVYGPALWMGFATNLLIAETWINLTRKNHN